MERLTQSGRRRAGYTLIELIIVMAIISVLIAVAVPIYTRSIQRSKETVLHQNLFNLRTVIDEYTFDKKAAPQLWISAAFLQHQCAGRKNRLTARLPIF